MRVVVVGAGKLGYSIAGLMATEGYEVVIIDNEASQLDAIRDTIDAMPICANGASPATLNNLMVRGADLLIAVTGSDEVNMLTCTLAKKNKIRHTIARVRDVDFLAENGDYLKKQLEIDLMLNPELITAQEIYRILMTSKALNVEDFASGKVRLFETKIRRDSKLLNTPLRDMEMPQSILAAMIFRDHEMKIPHGNDVFLPGDNAYFVGNPQAIEQFSSRFVESETRKLERVMIIGAGRTGRFLAPMLTKAGVRVKVIEKNPERMHWMSELLGDDGLVINGDGADIDLLKEEEVDAADVVVCLTEDETLNLMLALLAKHRGARETVVRVARTEYVDLMEQVGVDIVVAARLLSASEVLAFARRGGVVAVSLLEGAQAEAIEVIVQSQSRVSGRPLREVHLPSECLVCAYVRGDSKDAVIANGDTVLLPGDRVILMLDTRASQKVISYFKGKTFGL